MHFQPRLESESNEGVPSSRLDLLHIVSTPWPYAFLLLSGLYEAIQVLGSEYKQALMQEEAWSRARTDEIQLTPPFVAGSFFFLLLLAGQQPNSVCRLTAAAAAPTYATHRPPSVVLPSSPLPDGHATVAALFTSTPQEAE